MQKTIAGSFCIHDVIQGHKLSKYNKTFGFGQVEFSQQTMKAEKSWFFKISNLIYLFLRTFEEAHKH